MATVRQDRSLTRRIKRNEGGAFGCVEETAGSKVKRETNEVGTATQFSWLCARFWQPSLSPWIFSRRRGRAGWRRAKVAGVVLRRAKRAARSSP